MRGRTITKIERKKFVIVFDLPREFHSERKRVNLELKRINAKMIQFSVWESEKLKELMAIALIIKRFGGVSKILEEKFLF